jgi:hypothetical protein
MIDVLFTNEPRDRIEELFAVRGERHLLYCSTLPRGEHVGIAWAHATYDNRDLTIPARPGGGSELLFSSQDPHQTGRPVRMEFSKTQLSDGAAQFVWELGGHAMPPGTKYRPPRVEVPVVHDP